MHIESDYWFLALRAALLLAAFTGFAWALVSARRQAEQASAQVAARLETALGEIRRLSGQVLVLGSSIESLGTQLTQAHAHAQAQAQVQAQALVPRPAPSANSTHTRGYETAIRMARSGSTVEEIVASCGTTRAEAKLLRRLHECGEPRKAASQLANFA